MAYWLEMKSTFERFNIQMPLLNARYSIMWLDKGKLKKLDKLSMDAMDFFEEEAESNKKLSGWESIETSRDKDIEFRRANALMYKKYEKLRFARLCHYLRQLDPDTLLVRLVDTDPWTMAAWRGLLSGAAITEQML